MASKHQHLSLYREETVPNGDSFRLGIVVSEWNTDITEKTVSGLL
jgi:6,7-dimethyl-8-ribityllumazine synthase